MLSRVSLLRAASVRTKAVLPDLPYQYHELEPYISADIMELHHSKHHQTYVNNLNVANEALQEAIHAGDVTKQIQLNNGIKFNGGGHLNHTIFWQVRTQEILAGKRLYNRLRICHQMVVENQKEISWLQLTVILVHSINSKPR